MSSDRLSCLDCERITKDVSDTKSNIKFIYVTPEEASTGNFGRILQSLNEAKKLSYFAVDDGE